MRPVEFIIKDGDEHLTSHSGLALIGALMDRTELGDRIDAVSLPGCREPKIPHSDIVKAMKTAATGRRIISKGFNSPEISPEENRN